MLSRQEQSESTELAQLDAEEDLAIRLSQIGSMTTHNGLLRCRVHDFVTSKENTKVVLRVETPFNVAEDDYELFHFKLPPTWDEKYELPRVFSWYDYNQNNWHVWEGAPIYLRFTGIGKRENNYQWEIAPPPPARPSPARKLMYRASDRVKGTLRRPVAHTEHPVWAFTVTTLSATTTAGIVMTIATQSILATIMFSVIFAGATLMGYAAMIGVIGDVAGWWSFDD